jgi:hypothetical protein
MKTLTKTENVKRWLESGKALRQHQAKVNWNLERLAPIIARLKERGMWIINIGKPGKHANYIMIERGPIKNLIIKGYILEVLSAHYMTWGFDDMVISIQADNGRDQKTFRCNSSAFRDKKVMEKLILS